MKKKNISASSAKQQTVDNKNAAMSQCLWNLQANYSKCFDHKYILPVTKSNEN